MFRRRTPRATWSETKSAREGGSTDRDLLTALMIFWAVSLARVVMGLVHHETFGAEGTLAFLTVLVVPWLICVGRFGGRGMSRAPNQH